MWIFGSNGLLCITAIPGNLDSLFIKTKNMAHLKHWFPEENHLSKCYTAYPHRAVVSREVVAAALMKYLMSMEYEDFKNSIGESPYHLACSNIYDEINSYGKYRQRSDFEN